MTEPTYTLDQAARILRERECAMHGHDWEIIMDGMGQPLTILCGRCSVSWAVVKKYPMDAQRTREPRDPTLPSH